MNYDDINGLYQHYLGRGASPDEAQGWLSGTYGPPDPQSIAAQIAQSGEAQAYQSAASGGRVPGPLPWWRGQAPTPPDGAPVPKGPFPGGMPESSRGFIGGAPMVTPPSSGPVPKVGSGDAPPGGPVPKGGYGDAPPVGAMGGGAAPPAFTYGDFQARPDDAALQQMLDQARRYAAVARARGGAVGSYL